MFYLIFRFITKLQSFYHHRIWLPGVKRSLGSCGKDVFIGRGSTLDGAENVYIDNGVWIGADAHFMSSDSNILIKKKVLLAPKVTVVTGDHRCDVVGKFLADVHEKLPQNDADVVIEEEAWIGTGCIILKGVTVGRGAVVAAGSVVTKSIPPYSICAGVPAKVLKMRFTPEQIAEHEARLYS